MTIAGSIRFLPRHLTMIDHLYDDHHHFQSRGLADRAVHEDMSHISRGILLFLLIRMQVSQRHHASLAA